MTFKRIPERYTDIGPQRTASPRGPPRRWHGGQERSQQHHLLNRLAWNRHGVLAVIDRALTITDAPHTVRRLPMADDANFPVVACSNVRAAPGSIDLKNVFNMVIAPRSQLLKSCNLIEHLAVFRVLHVAPWTVATPSAGTPYANLIFTFLALLRVVACVLGLVLQALRGAL